MVAVRRLVSHRDFDGLGTLDLSCGLGSCCAQYVWPDWKIFDGFIQEKGERIQQERVSLF